jgi:hypothetical protein
MNTVIKIITICKPLAEKCFKFGDELTNLVNEFAVNLVHHEKSIASKFKHPLLDVCKPIIDLLNIYTFFSSFLQLT